METVWQFLNKFILHASTVGVLLGTPHPPLPPLHFLTTAAARYQEAGLVAADFESIPTGSSRLPTTTCLKLF